MANAPCLLCLTLPAALIGSTSGYAVTYLTVEQAQAALWPGVKLAETSVLLSPGQKKAVEKTAGIRVRQSELKAWRTPDDGWFLVDLVMGKHEYITYAVAITAGGEVAGLEILDYRESYGGEIRNRRWLAQFAGRNVASPLRLDQDIRNISGATLSCRNITDGVKRLLVTHDLVLKYLR